MSLTASAIISVIYCIQNCTVGLYSLTDKKRTYWTSQIKYRWL